ncbi:hypothetical protein I3760_03G062000 [Carya illinoinensis]|uniref:Benzyl alcohol O-benzoyltransferase n=1 Tax=Carya illinoinensis TaxID=32201 RepID=A0A922FH46_CARIL|nr:hypothetical protein I3760_03G062000 [Carya illinoinensis]KAG6720475.1 hypothetical protein I3842_03G064500 [Carya illinoinensis]
MAPLNFLVHVGEPELVQPEKPTPKEFKYLSNIDEQSGLRNHIPFVHFYSPILALGAQVQDPITMIKRSLAKVLVFYFPVACRLRNADQGKLVVDCCGEGVIFRGAIADPPFPQWDKLLVDDIWGNNLITDSPLLRMQVTRLACGGFILAYTFNHCICDAYGAYQFITVVSEFCKDPNRRAPSTLRSWERETLRPRSPPIISYPIMTLKNKITGKCATFDAVASCLWRARTRTLINPKSNARLMFPIDTRFRYKSSLPNGYYGTAVVFPCAITKAAKLVKEPLYYFAKLISEVRRGVGGDEYRASALDFIELNGPRGFYSEEAFVVSDMSRLRGVYGGPARAGTGMVPGMMTSIIGHKNEGESLERLHKEVRKEIASITPAKTISAL